MDFIHPFKKFREKNNFSAKDFAKKVFPQLDDSTARSYLSQIENFSRKFPKKRMDELIKLGFSESEIREVSEIKVIENRNKSGLITTENINSLSKVIENLGGKVSFKMAIQLLEIIKNPVNE